ncbi:MAG TPA: DUF4440 domain-containing protein [Thermoanaerobaculia bacterium]|nr:DUF4440 domain-containing protein [Thermoanaerobaculia bacterium]
MRRGLSGILVVSLAAASTLAEPARSDPTPARTARLGDPFVDAFNRGDFSAIKALYAEDAALFPPGSAPVRGRPSIEAFWKGTRNLGIRSIERNVIDSESIGNLAVETGREVMRVQSVGPAEALVHLKYLLVWKKDKDGSWKIYRDIWNNMPAAGAPPAPHR